MLGSCSTEGKPLPLLTLRYACSIVSNPVFAGREDVPAGLVHRCALDPFGKRDEPDTNRVCHFAVSVVVTSGNGRGCRSGNFKLPPRLPPSARPPIRRGLWCFQPFTNKSRAITPGSCLVLRLEPTSASSCHETNHHILQHLSRPLL